MSRQIAVGGAVEIPYNQRSVRASAHANGQRRMNTKRLHGAIMRGYPALDIAAPRYTHNGAAVAGHERVALESRVMRDANAVDRALTQGDVNFVLSTRSRIRSKMCRRWLCAPVITTPDSSSRVTAFIRIRPAAGSTTAQPLRIRRRQLAPSERTRRRSQQPWHRRRRKLH